MQTYYFSDAKFLFLNAKLLFFNDYTKFSVAILALLIEYTYLCIRNIK